MEDFSKANTVTHLGSVSFSSNWSSDPDARLSKSIALAHSFPALCTVPHEPFSQTLLFSGLSFFTLSMCEMLIRELRVGGGCVGALHESMGLRTLWGGTGGLWREDGETISQAQPFPGPQGRNSPCMPLTVPSSASYSKLPCELYHQWEGGSDCRLGLTLRPCLIY